MKVLMDEPGFARRYAHLVLEHLFEQRRLDDLAVDRWADDGGPPPPAPQPAAFARMDMGALRISEGVIEVQVID